MIHFHGAMRPARIHIRTRRGLCAWIARRIELWSVSATLRWAESDRDLLAEVLDHAPRRLKQMDRDLEMLRVRQATLRNT